MKKIKTGVIGTGHLGTLHVKMLKNIESTELLGVYDTSKERAEKCANEFGIKVFATLEELVLECEAASIAVTTTAHYSVARFCLEHGLDVFIEKPVTATIEEAEKLVALAKEKGKLIQVGHIERFNPAILAVDKYNLEPKFIQTDRLAQFNPRGTDVAVVLDLMIHDIDIILSLVKSEVVKVDASGIAVVSPTTDIANCRIEFANGAVAVVTASRISQKKMRKMRLFQKDNYITLDFITGTTEIYRLVSPSEPSGAAFSFGLIGVGANAKSVVYEQAEAPKVNALEYELELFIKAVIERTTPVVSGEDGLKALQVAHMIGTKIEESIHKINSNMEA
ncbi:MAG: Gfo/Idh/MocA family oxidoreductase [Bacteroidetes bacterium]|nr:Gfo/Idh/MocA family oxidoreductase [Bacteroidota bacterium]